MKELQFDDRVVVQLGEKLVKARVATVVDNMVGVVFEKGGPVTLYDAPMVFPLYRYHEKEILGTIQKVEFQLLFDLGTRNYG